MLGLGDLKQTRAYQEAEQAGRMEEREEMLAKTVPNLLRKGLTVQEIADVLELPVDVIQPFLPKN